MKYDIADLCGQKRRLRAVIHPIPFRLSELTKRSVLAAQEESGSCLTEL